MDSDQVANRWPMWPRTSQKSHELQQHSWVRSFQNCRRSLRSVSAHHPVAPSTHAVEGEPEIHTKAWQIDSSATASLYTSLGIAVDVRIVCLFVQATEDDVDIPIVLPRRGLQISAWKAQRTNSFKVMSSLVAGFAAMLHSSLTSLIFSTSGNAICSIDDVNYIVLSMEALLLGLIDALCEQKCMPYIGPRVLDILCYQLVHAPSFQRQVLPTCSD